MSHRGPRMTRALVGHPGRVGEPLSFRVSVLFRLRWLLVALSVLGAEAALCRGARASLLSPWCRALARRAHSALDLQERAVSLFVRSVPVGGPGSHLPVNVDHRIRSVTTWVNKPVTPFGFRLPFSIITYPI